MQKDPDRDPTIGETNPEPAGSQTDEVRDPSGEINDGDDGRSNVEGGLGKTPQDVAPE
jgi:hypothetical protein